MKSALNFSAMLLCWLLIIGCTSARSESAKNKEDFIASALKHSKTWAYVTSLSSKSFFTIEAESSSDIEVILGSGTAERFERLGTVRILKKDGKVLKLEYDKRSEAIWIDDTLSKK